MFKAFHAIFLHVASGKDWEVSGGACLLCNQPLVTAGTRDQSLVSGFAVDLRTEGWWLGYYSAGNVCFSPLKSDFWLILRVLPSCSVCSECSGQTGFLRIDFPKGRQIFALLSNTLFQSAVTFSEKAKINVFLTGSNSMEHVTTLGNKWAEKCENLFVVQDGLSGMSEGFDY